MLIFITCGPHYIRHSTLCFFKCCYSILPTEVREYSFYCCSDLRQLYTSLVGVAPRMILLVAHVCESPYKHLCGAQNVWPHGLCTPACTPTAHALDQGVTILISNETYGTHYWWVEHYSFCKSVLRSYFVYHCHVDSRLIIQHVAHSRKCYLNLTLYRKPHGINIPTYSKVHKNICYNTTKDVV